jgi:hypothetical protein
MMRLKFLMNEFLTLLQNAEKEKKELVNSTYGSMPEIIGSELSALDKKIAYLNEQIQALVKMKIKVAPLLSRSEIQEDPFIKNVLLREAQSRLAARITFLELNNKILKDHNTRLKQYNHFLEKQYSK